MTVPLTTMIPSSLIDGGSGAGSGTPSTQDFLTGVGFVAGTTTQLTLNQTPATAYSTFVFFDGVNQSFNTWSLSGSTVTFMAPIPLGTEVVEVKFVVPVVTGTLVSQSAGNIAVTGGTMDDVIIGANVQASGNFTTLNSSQVATFNGYGYGNPTVTNRSGGTHIVLRPNMGTTSYDSAIGIDSNFGVWLSTLANGGFSFWESPATSPMASIHNQPYFGSNVGELDISYITNGSYATRALGNSGTIGLAPYIYFFDALSGTPLSANEALVTFTTTSDTLAAGSAGITMLGINVNAGGTGTTGPRGGISVELNYAGGTTNKSHGIQNQTIGIQSYTNDSGNDGGTIGSNWGTTWGGVISGLLLSGATYKEAVCGLEIDVGVGTGASAARVQGAKVVLQTHNQAVNPTGDFYLSLCNGGSPIGLANGFVLGSDDAWWPLDSTGTIFRYQYPNGGVTGSPAAVAANGWYLPDVYHTNSAWQTPGYKLDGSGNETIGSNTISWSSSGLQISAQGSVGAYTSIAAPGTNYAVGHLLLDQYGGLWKVSTVASGGVTGVTLLTAPTITSGSTPSNPITTKGIYGTGCTLNIVWTSAPAISLVGAVQATAINSTPIGATTPSTGSFTAISTAANAVIGGALELYDSGTVTAQMFNQPYWGPNVSELDVSYISNGFYAARALGNSGTAALAPYINFEDALSGVPKSLSSAMATFQTSSDVLQAGAGGLSMLQVNFNAGGAACTGPRVGFTNVLNYTGGPNNAGLGISTELVGIQSYANVSGNTGGTSGAANGYTWGGVISGKLLTGATYHNSVTGLEVDFGVNSGANSNYTNGLNIVLQNHGQAVNPLGDSFLSLCSDGAPNTGSRVGLANGITFGQASGGWPVDSGGCLVSYQKANSGVTGTLPAIAANGWYLPGVYFTNEAIATPSFSVAGTGNVTIGSNTLTWSSSGLSIGAQGKVGAFSSLAAGGSNYAAGQTLTDLYGGLWQVTTINGSAVATLTLLNAPVVTSGSAPSNPISLTGLYGSGCTVNLSWTSAANVAVTASTLSVTGIVSTGTVESTTPYLFLDTQYGIGLVVHSSATATASLLVETSTAGQVTLAPSGPSGVNLVLNPTSGGTVYVSNGPFEVVGNQINLGSLSVAGTVTSGTAVWSSGTGVPTSSTPGYTVGGSMFSRTDGSTGSRLYVSTGSGWNAVAGV